MGNQDVQQAKVLFQEALELPAEERASFLETQCGSNQELRHHVEDLLRAHESGLTDFLRTAAPLAEFDTLPERIGRYTVVRKIGFGGMGVVYEAKQERPNRTVALKVIRPGLASNKLVARFQHEADLLGRLQHHGIAHIYEAGVSETRTQDGQLIRQPFFAMEYLAGSTLSDYISERNLTIADRLELFARICDAIHHAHQKGVIHRDLKPGNIVVDTAGQPKVLDFGVARATDADVLTVTLQTDAGQIVGTLPYMSPEQVQGNSDALDTRSDVYSLGVILYEVLSGRLPHDLSKRTIADAARIILESDPPKLGSIQPECRGDLEAIAAKALEKDRDHRYSSAAEFAMDVRRYLHHEPITARPLTTFYQLCRFTRRNRMLVGGVLLLFLVLAAGVVTSSVFAVREIRARDQADLERKEAVRQAKIAQAVNELLTAVDPENTADRDITMREVLDQASERVADKSGGEPATEAAIRSTLGDVYYSLGRKKEAGDHFHRALELYRAALGDDNENTIAALVRVARSASDEGRYEEAEALYRTGLETCLRVYGETHPRVPTLIGNLANVYQYLGRYEDAERHYLRALEIRRRMNGEDHPETLVVMSNLARLYDKLGRSDEAEALFKIAIEHARKALGEDHPNTMSYVGNLAVLYYNKGKFDEAVPLLLQNLESRRRVLGDEHPATVAAMSNLGYVYRVLGRLDDARPLLEGACENSRRVQGDDDPQSLALMDNLALLHVDEKRYDLAEPLYRQVLESKRRVYGDDHALTLQTISGMARLYDETGHLDEAESFYRRTWDGYRRALGEDQVDTLTAAGNLAAFYNRRGQFDDALSILTGLVPRAKKALPDHWRVATLLTAYGAALSGLKRYDEAEAALLEAHQSFETSFGPNHGRTLGAMQLIATLYDAWEKPDEADKWRGRLADSARVGDTTASGQ